MFSENLKQTILAGIYSSAKIRSEYLQNGSFILQAANELHNSILSIKNCEEALEMLQHSSFLLSSMDEAMSLHKPDIHYSALVLSELLESILPSEEEWNKMKNNLTLTLMPSILKGKVFYPLDKEESTYCSSNKDESLLFASEVISSIFVNLIENSSSQESEAFFEQYVMKHTSELLWCLSFANENEMKTHVDKLSTNCCKILSFLPVEKVQELVNILFYSSLAEGIYWALPFRCLLEIIETVCSSHFLPQFPEMIFKANEYDSDNKYVTIQILLYYTEQRQKIWHLSHLLQELSKMEMESTVGILGEIAQLCCCLQGIQFIPLEMRSLLVDTFNKIMNMKFVEEEKFLHSVQMTAILSSILKCDSSLINMEDLYFFVDHLISLLKSAKDWKYEKPMDLLFLQHLSSMFIVISSYIFMHNDKNPEKSLELTSDIWKHADDENIYQEFIFFILRVAVVIKKMNLSSRVFKAVVSKLLEAVKFIPEKYLSDVLLYHSLESVELQGKDSEDINALDCLISCLSSNVRELQLASHVMLMKVMPVLPTLVSNAQKSEEDDDSEYEAKIPDKLSSLIQLLNFTNEVVQSMLSDIRIGDCCTVLPYTDSYTFALTYLLAWLEILEFISSSPSQIRSEYAAHLEENKLLSCLFSNVFCLMPDNPLAIIQTDSTPTKKGLKSLFLCFPSLTS
ncbi:E3 ubiquitin-protein ligase listerin, partial [Stegodyphus mimosarum]